MQNQDRVTASRELLCGWMNAKLVRGRDRSKERVWRSREFSQLPTDELPTDGLPTDGAPEPSGTFAVDQRWLGRLPGSREDDAFPAPSAFDREAADKDTAGKIDRSRVLVIMPARHMPA